MTLRRLVRRYLRKRSGLSKQILNRFIIAAKINDSGIFIEWRGVLNTRTANPTGHGAINFGPRHSKIAV